MKETIKVPLPRFYQVLNRFSKINLKSLICIQDAWAECDEATAVPYEPMCNQFIKHMMEPLRAVVYEPRACDPILGGLFRGNMYLESWKFKVSCDISFPSNMK